MEFPFEHEFPYPPAEMFERLRAFARFYPDLHPAHEPHPEGHEAPLLDLGVAFTVAERFGPERRVYAFRVTRFEPEAPRITLEAVTDTRIQVPWFLSVIGPLRFRSFLTVDWRVEPAPAGARVVARQTVRLPRPWLAPLLLPAAVRRKLAAHVAEESANACAIMASPTFMGDVTAASGE